MTLHRILVVSGEDIRQPHGRQRTRTASPLAQPAILLTVHQRTQTPFAAGAESSGRWRRRPGGRKPHIHPRATGGRRVGRTSIAFGAVGLAAEARPL